MNLWQKLTEPNQPNEWADEPEIQVLERQLDHLKYRARPEFQAELKTRLLAALEQPPLAATPANSRLHWVKKFLSGPNLTRLTVSSFGMAALVVLVISVLAANSLSSVQPITSQTIATITTSTTSAATQSPFSQPATGKLELFNPSSKNYVNTLEASRQLGFAVRQPTYLPANYKLDTAFLELAPQTSPLLPMRGYQLNYAATRLNGKAREIEIAEWETPLAVSTGPANNTNRPPQALPFGAVSGAKAAPIELASGVVAYYLEGPKWRIALSNRVQTVEEGVPITSIEIINPPDAPLPPEVLGASAVPASSELAQRNNPPGLKAAPGIDFTVSVAKPGGNVYVEFGNQPGSAKTRTFLWQQNNRLLLVSSDESIPINELKKVAVGFLEAK